MRRFFLEIVNVEHDKTRLFLSFYPVIKVLSIQCIYVRVRVRLLCHLNDKRFIITHRAKLYRKNINRVTFSFFFYRIFLLYLIRCIESDVYLCFLSFFFYEPYGNKKSEEKKYKEIQRESRVVER